LSPIFWVLALVLAFTGSEPVLGSHGGAVVATSYLSLVAGNGVLTLLAMLAPLRRGWRHLAPYGLSVSLYWLLISLAAHKALWQLVRRPFYWEKTQHGVARRKRPPSQWRLAVARLAPIIAVLACFAAQVAAANPWLKEAGTGELIANLTVTREETGLSAAAAEATSGLHLEYGAGARATLVLDEAVQRQTATGNSVTQFDSASAGVRAVLVQSDYSVLSTELVGGVAGVRRSAALPGISLNGRAEARLMYGQGFEMLGRHAFASMETGWRWRGGAPADELMLDLGVGMEPWGSGLLMLQSFSIVSTGPAGGAYRRYQLSKLQFSIAQRLTPALWVQAGLVGTVAGAGAGEAGILLGLWRRF